jgi:Ca-activated chloride channel family protein
VEGFRSIGARVRNMGASISAIGVDVEYNERVMSALALESNGRHHFVENAAKLPEVFDAELASLVKTVSKDTEVELALAPGVSVERVFDRTFRQEGDRLIVPFGTFSAGEQKTLLVKLAVAKGATGTRPIADVKMSYDDFAQGGRGNCAGSLALALSDDTSLVPALDPVVQTRLVRSETAATLKEANRLFTSGRTREARGALKRSLEQVNRQRQAALAQAPAPARAKLKADFDDQSGALGEASEGFASPPADAPAAGAAAPRPAAQVRKNASVADEFAF